MKEKKTRRRPIKRWLKRYEEMKYHVFLYGNKSISRKKFSTLAEWINNQRRAYRNELLIKEDLNPKSKHRILDAQINLLNNDKFIWNTAKSNRKIFNVKNKEELYSILLS